MGWLAIILEALKLFGPLIIQLILKLINKSHTLSPADQVQAKAEVLAAIRTGNEENVKTAVDHWDQRCLGVACPADLVGSASQD